ncbi:hypothetical protein [Paenibacillus sp. y28]|uniref:hypothetical protein n=1 Tax=Paenibacillus sp. y28 TaxID=3129110 RepID=UPI0030177FFF
MSDVEIRWADPFTLENRKEYYQRALYEGQHQIALLLVGKQVAGCIAIGACRDHDSPFERIGYARVSLWVLQDNTNARRFYEHLGLLCDGTEKVITRGKELVQVRYRMELDPI